MKSIASGNYFVEPFQTHKIQSYIYNHLMGNTSSVITIDCALNIPYDVTNPFDANTDAVNAISGIYQRPLYSSIQNLFYNSGSLWNGGKSLTTEWAPTGSSVYVISIAQPSFGEKITENSFVLQATTNDTIVDDGNGRLISSMYTGSTLGHIFYEFGIAIVQKNTTLTSSSLIDHNGMYLTTGSSINISFNACHTIYQNTVLCTIDIGDFNYSTNPSIAATQSVYDVAPIKVMDGFASGSLTPYMTSVGLYNDQQELVAIAKFPHPIKRATNSQQTVIVRFDI